LPGFRPDVGYEFRFSAGPEEKKYVHLCKVTEVIDGKKIAYTWRYDGYEGDSLVAFELFPQGDQTKLKLTHAGLETFPKGNPDLAKKNFEEGWADILGNSLKNFVEAVEREIVLSRVFEASRERVFEAMADPKQVVQWWGPDGFTTTIHEMDVRPGGAWKHTMRGPDGTDYPNASVFLEVDKPGRIVYQHAGGIKERGGACFKATWTFEEQDGRMKLTMRLTFGSAEERGRTEREYQAIEGGKQTLGRLAEFLKTRK
jgi:uncharacterized protein YndB with AHSA1/START domain